MMRTIPASTTPTVCGTADFPPPVPCTSKTAPGMEGGHRICNRCGITDRWKSRGVLDHTNLIACSVIFLNKSSVSVLFMGNVTTLFGLSPVHLVLIGVSLCYYTFRSICASSPSYRCVLIMLLRRFSVYLLCI